MRLPSYLKGGLLRECDCGSLTPASGNPLQVVPPPTPLLSPLQVRTFVYRSASVGGLSQLIVSSLRLRAGLRQSTLDLEISLGVAICRGRAGCRELLPRGGPARERPAALYELGRLSCVCSCVPASGELRAAEERTEGTRISP